MNLQIINLRSCFAELHSEFEAHTVNIGLSLSRWTQTCLSMNHHRNEDEVYLRYHQSALYRSGGVFPLNTPHLHWSMR